MGSSLISATYHSLISDEWLRSPAPHTLYLANSLTPPPSRPVWKITLGTACIRTSSLQELSDLISFPSIYIQALLGMAGAEMLESTQAGPLPPRVQDAVIQVGLWWCVLVQIRKMRIQSHEGHCPNRKLAPLSVARATGFCKVNTISAPTLALYQVSSHGPHLHNLTGSPPQCP